MVKFIVWVRFNEMGYRQHTSVSVLHKALSLRRTTGFRPGLIFEYINIFMNSKSNYMTWAGEVAQC